MDTSAILRYILGCQGSVDREELECNLGDASFTAEMIRNNSHVFVSCSVNGIPKVVALCPVKLCRVKGCSDCGELHVCKNLLLSGDCPLLHTSIGCIFPHDLQSENNMEVLRKFGLETLSRTELCLLLLQSNNTLLPPVCHDYNNPVGCQGERQGVCPRLHICERHLSDGRHSDDCGRRHNFSEPQPLKLLRDKHIPEHLFKVLKSVYANKEALRQAEKRKAVGERTSTEDSPTDGTAYDSDSSRSSVSTSQSESRKPRKRGGRKHAGKRRNQTQVQNKSRYGSQDPKSSEERGCNEQQHWLSSPDTLASFMGLDVSLESSILEFEQKRSEHVDGACNCVSKVQKPRGENANPASDPWTTPANKSDAKSYGKQGHEMRDKTEICMFFIRGHCRDEGACPRAHDKMPYRWEVKRDGRWTPLADNETIEKDYCDPKKTFSSTSPPVHFQTAQGSCHTMMCGKNKVRRLSTVNSILKPHYSHTTDWLWYFKDDNGQWNQYSAATNLFVICEQRIIIITSEELEARYLRNSHDVLMFSSHSQWFSLSFQDMIQTNLMYGSGRLVRRRPRLVSAAEAQTKRKCPTRSNPAPGNSDDTQLPQTGHTKGTPAFKTKTKTSSSSLEQTTLASTLKTSHHTSPTSASATSKTVPPNVFSSTGPATSQLTFTTTSSKMPLETFPALQNVPKPVDGFSTPSSSTTLPTNPQYIFQQTGPTTFGTSFVSSAPSSVNTITSPAPVSQFPFSSSSNKSKMTSATLQTSVFHVATPTVDKMAKKASATNSSSSNSQMEPHSQATSQITLTTTSNMRSETVSALQIANLPKPLDRSSTSSTATLTNPQFIFPQTCPATFGTSGVASRARLALATQSSNPFLTELSSPNSQMNIRESQLTSTTPRTSELEFGTATKMTKFTSATKSSNPFLTDISSNSQLKTTKSQLAFPTPQNTPGIPHGSAEGNTSGAKSGVAVCEFGSDANSQRTFASTSKSQQTTATMPKATASEINSPNAFSGSSPRSQMTIRRATSANKSVTISQHSLATTSAGNTTEQFPITMVKSPATSPETASKSQFDAVRSAAKFTSASPFGYAAVSFSGAATSAGTTAEKENEQKKTCVIQ